MAHAVQQAGGNQQLGLYDHADAGVAARARAGRPPVPQPRVCAGCRANEARYGFRDESAGEPGSRPRTLCFQCFRVELGRRQAVEARLARSWNARQAQLPLEERLQEVTRRRRRAQIAARHALGL